MDRVIERVPHSINASLRGAAVLAGLALGALTPADVRDTAPVEQTFRPDPSTRAAYDKLYAEFPKLYKAQRGMFSRVNG
jgi:xylulokinase